MGILTALLAAIAVGQTASENGVEGIKALLALTVLVLVGLVVGGLALAYGIEFLACLNTESC